MFIGHLPAGYLVAQGLERYSLATPTMWWSVVAGSVLPDVDMLWFYLVDHASVHHHTYLTHDPTLWIAVTLIGLSAPFLRVYLALGLGALLHLVLDSIVGSVGWNFWFFSWFGPLVVVPATQNHWILSFVLHWTFAVELLLCLLATAVFVQRRRAK